MTIKNVKICVSVDFRTSLDANSTEVQVFFSTRTFDAFKAIFLERHGLNSQRDVGRSEPKAYTLDDFMSVARSAVGATPTALALGMLCLSLKDSPKQARFTIKKFMCELHLAQDTEGFDDPAFVSKVIDLAESAEPFRWASPELQKNPDLALRALVFGFPGRELDESLRGDPVFMLHAAQKNILFLQYATEALLKEMNFLLHAFVTGDWKQLKENSDAPSSSEEQDQFLAEIMHERPLLQSLSEFQRAGRDTKTEQAWSSEYDACVMAIPQDEKESDFIFSVTRALLTKYTSPLMTTRHYKAEVKAILRQLDTQAPALADQHDAEKLAAVVALIKPLSEQTTEKGIEGELNFVLMYLMMSLAGYAREQLARLKDSRHDDELTLSAAHVMADADADFDVSAAASGDAAAAAGDDPISSVDLGHDEKAGAEARLAETLHALLNTRLTSREFHMLPLSGEATIFFRLDGLPNQTTLEIPRPGFVVVRTHLDTWKRFDVKAFHTRREARVVGMLTQNLSHEATAKTLAEQFLKSVFPVLSQYGSGFDEKGFVITAMKLTDSRFPFHFASDDLKKDMDVLSVALPRLILTEEWREPMLHIDIDDTVFSNMLNLREIEDQATAGMKLLASIKMLREDILLWPFLDGQLISACDGMTMLHIGIFGGWSHALSRLTEVESIIYSVMSHDNPFILMLLKDIMALHVGNVSPSKTELSDLEEIYQDSVGKKIQFKAQFYAQDIEVALPADSDFVIRLIAQALNYYLSNESRGFLGIFHGKRRHHLKPVSELLYKAFSENHFDFSSEPSAPLNNFNKAVEIVLALDKVGCANDSVRSINGALSLVLISMTVHLVKYAQSQIDRHEMKGDVSSAQEWRDSLQKLMYIRFTNREFPRPAEGFTYEMTLPARADDRQLQDFNDLRATLAAMMCGGGSRPGRGRFGGGR